MASRIEQGKTFLLRGVEGQVSGVSGLGRAASPNYGVEEALKQVGLTLQEKRKNYINGVAIFKQSLYTIRKYGAGGLKGQVSPES